MQSPGLDAIKKDIPNVKSDSHYPQKTITSNKASDIHVS